jgi:hypothetical protein
VENGQRETTKRGKVVRKRMKGGVIALMSKKKKKKKKKKRKNIDYNTKKGGDNCTKQMELICL